MEKVISSQIVFKCPIFKVEQAEVELPNGNIEKRWYVVKKNAVGIIPFQSNKVTMIREYRSAAGEKRWRIPAGGIKDNELPEDAARRELREEIGYDCKKLKMILQYKSPSAIIKQVTYFFIATELFSNPLKTEEWEEIELVKKTPEEIRELLYTGQIEGGIAAALNKFIEKIDSNDLF